jgi:hypothetical protein
VSADGGRASSARQLRSARETAPAVRSYTKSKENFTSEFIKFTNLIGIDQNPGKDFLQPLRYLPRSITSL